ncbi:hypothetical protein ACWGNM_07440 [Streptomyces sp. NPDC055796]
MIVSSETLLPTTGAHTSTTYADWVAAHDPGAAGSARDLIEDMRTELGRSRTKPGRFVDTMAARARRLPAAHLPWFWDTVGHRLIGYGSRPGGRAYAAARSAEARHGLPVDPAYRRANALLFAAGGAMPAKEFGAHQHFLAETLEPSAAHTALEEFLTAWAGSRADLPADLVRRVRASAKAAGHDDEEAARLVGAILSVTRKKSVPDALLDAATTVLTAHPPAEDVAAGLVEVFPDGVTDGGAWLRMLIGCGAAAAMAAGRVVPEGGLHGWVGNYVRMYQYAAQSGGGVARQPLPVEFLDLVGRLGPRLRAEGAAVTVHTTRHHHQGFDADVLDAFLAAGVAVVDPGPETRMRFWGERSRRDLSALAADPVFGPRLEGTVHADLMPRWGPAPGRRAGSAVTLLPGNEGIAQEVAVRVGKLVDTVAGGGMAGAEEAVAELEAVLDRPTVSALDGITDALAGAGAAGALRRSLAAGLPEELAWPALESVYAEFAAGADGEEAQEGLPGAAGVAGVTATWPVLTVFGRDRAVAVGPHGVRGSCRFTVPDGATMYAVHYVGGSFLVSWTLEPNPYHCDTAVWADRPAEVFAPDELSGLVPFGGSLDGAYGFQFESADGGGRHDGRRVLRPGGTQGIDGDELQLGDGSRIWTNAVFGRRPWELVDPVTGEPCGAVALPDFPGRPASDDPAAEPSEAGMAPASEALQLAPLPAGLAASPLGSREGLVGTRVLFRTRHRNHAPDHYLVESVDGRTARFDIDRPGQEPWGLWAPPEGAVQDVVLAEAQTRTGVRAYAADGALLWELDGHRSTRHPVVAPVRRVTASGGRGAAARLLAPAADPGRGRVAGAEKRGASDGGRTAGGGPHGRAGAACRRGPGVAGSRRSGAGRGRGGGGPAGRPGGGAQARPAPAGEPARAGAARPAAPVRAGHRADARAVRTGLAGRRRPAAAQSCGEPARDAERARLGRRLPCGDRRRGGAAALAAGAAARLVAADGGDRRRRLAGGGGADRGRGAGRSGGAAGHLGRPAVRPRGRPVVGGPRVRRGPGRAARGRARGGVLAGTGRRLGMLVRGGRHGWGRGSGAGGGSAGAARPGGAG